MSSSNISPTLLYNHHSKLINNNILFLASPAIPIQNRILQWWWWRRRRCRRLEDLIERQKPVTQTILLFNFSTPSEKQTHATTTITPKQTDRQTHRQARRWRNEWNFRKSNFFHSHSFFYLFESFPFLCASSFAMSHHHIKPPLRTPFIHSLTHLPHQLSPTSPPYPYI